MTRNINTNTVNVGGQFRSTEYEESFVGYVFRVTYKEPFFGYGDNEREAILDLSCKKYYWEKKYSKPFTGKDNIDFIITFLKLKNWKVVWREGSKEYDICLNGIDTIPGAESIQLDFDEEIAHIVWKG